MAKFEKLGPRGMRESKSKFTVHDETAQEIGKGIAEGTVRKVRVDMSLGEKTRILSLAQKTFDVETDNNKRQELIARILLNNLRLKERKVATIPTMRSQKGDTWVLNMTDLTHDGTCEVISVTDWHKSKDSEGKFYRNQESFFISNPEEIVNTLNDIFVKSVLSGAEFEFHPDSIFVQINKSTRKATVLLGDIAGIKFKEPDYKYRKWLVESNFRSLKDFIKLISPHIKTVRPIDIQILKASRRRLLTEAKTKVTKANSSDDKSLLTRVRKLFS
jgi:hypothetical protein